MKNERGEMTTDTKEVQRTVRNYYKQLYVKKFKNLGDMDTLLEKHYLVNLNEEEAEGLNRPKTAGKIGQ